MSPIAPFVRLMLLCDSVEVSPDNPRKVDVYGLLTSARPAPDSGGYPVRVSFCVYLAVTGGRGEGEVKIVVLDSESNEVAYESLARKIDFGADPLLVRGIIFRILGCPFPRRGLYWVEFRYNDEGVFRQAILLE